MDFYADFTNLSRSNGGASIDIDIVDLEGNVAAGKTTLLALIAAAPEHMVGLLKLKGDTVPPASAYYTQCAVVPEPLEQWTAVGASGRNLLADAYGDAKRAGFACQLNIVATRLDAIFEQLRAIHDASVDYSAMRILLVTERSTLADQHVFAAAMHESGAIDDAEWAVYERCVEAAHRAWRARVAGLFGARYGSVRVTSVASVLLQIDDELALKRIRARGRSYELGITAPVLRAIAARHRRVFMRQRDELGIAHRCVVCVDATMLYNVLAGRAKKSLLMPSTLAPKGAPAQPCEC